MRYKLHNISVHMYLCQYHCYCLAFIEPDTHSTIAIVWHSLNQTPTAYLNIVQVLIYNKTITFLVSEAGDFGDSVLKLSFNIANFFFSEY